MTGPGGNERAIRRQHGGMAPTSHDHLHGAPGSPRRNAINAWLIANDIDPNNVCDESEIRIHGDGQSRVIAFTAFVRSSDGNIRATDDGYAMREQRTAPCDHEPPAWLGIPGSS